MSYERKIFSQKAMELADEILRYEVEIERLADENERYEDMVAGISQLKELNREMVEALRDIQAFIIALKAYVPVGIDSLSSYKAVMKQTQTVLAKAEEGEGE